MSRSFIAAVSTIALGLLIFAGANRLVQNTNANLPNTAMEQSGQPSIERLPVDQEIKHRPVALCFGADPSLLFVANRNSGCVSVIDTELLKIPVTWKIGGEITDVVHWFDQVFLITDYRDHKVKCVSFTGRPFVVWEQTVSKYPIRLSISPDRQTCFVAGLWSRRIDRFELPRNLQTKPGDVESLDLNFAPGLLCHSKTGRELFVFDAFGDRYAAIDTLSLAIAAAGDFSSRRIGGAAVDPLSKTIATTQQLLNRLARATRNDVHWGMMISNDLRLISRERLLEQPYRPFNEIPSIPLGGTGNAKGDPGCLSFSGQGIAAISIGGVRQVAIGRPGRDGFRYVDVGRRPTANIFSPDGQRLFVANHLDDSVSVIDVAESNSIATIPLGQRPELTMADRGERLFFDARLSHDRWMSCHSCHVEGHTSGFLNDNFSDQSFGAPKRVLSLLGHADTSPFAWNGSAATLTDQIRNSIEITMQSDRPATEQQVQALAAYLRNLPAPPSLADARDQAVGERIDAGRHLFEELGCQTCHDGTQLTSEQNYDVGLQDELGNRNFNPPSLIGVSQRNRLFHDGSAASLEEVLVKFRHRLTKDLSDVELQALLSYLKNL